MTGRKTRSPVQTAAALMAVILCLAPTEALAAIGCTLTNPAQDLKYLFPEMTTYREEVRELHRMKDGRALYSLLRERLGSDLDPVYETYETPYTIYTVFKGKGIIGIVHGVNVPGEGGVIQVFISVDPKSGAIRQVFYQRLESIVARALRNRAFLDQFKAISLADYYKHDYYKVAESAGNQDRIAKIKSPLSDQRGMKDYEASVRGVRKNLILLDIFVYEQRNEPFYQRAKDALAKLKK